MKRGGDGRASLGEKAVFSRISSPSGEQPFLRIHHWSTIERLETLITAVRQQLPGLNVILKPNGEDIIHDDIAPLRMKDGKENFDSAIEIARHEVCASDKDFMLSRVVKVEDSGMFQEATDDGAYPNGVTHSGNAGS
jgi:hypothetical protein